MLPFRSLDPFRPLREPDRRRRDEERLSRSEQRTANKPKDHLTGKAPYRFESGSLQQRVQKGLSAMRNGGSHPTLRRVCAERGRLTETQKAQLGPDGARSLWPSQIIPRFGDIPSGARLVRLHERRLRTLAWEWRVRRGNPAAGPGIRALIREFCGLAKKRFSAATDEPTHQCRDGCPVRSGSQTLWRSFASEI